MRELLIKKCCSCGSTIKVLKDCHCGGCGIVCCGKSMDIIEANSVDASYEKHIPTYEIKDGKLEAKVNHVMDSDHYIEWICLVTDSSEEYVYLNPGEDAIVTFNNTTGTLYSYCNNHGLWKNEVK